MSMIAALREAIETSDKSPYQLAREANLSPIQLSRFLRGERDLRLATVDRLTKVLELSLTPDRNRRSACS